MKLLTIGNTKTVKGEKLGYMTFIMHLAPADLSGFNVCPMASEGCRAACLNTAGRGRFDNTQLARIAKTQWFFADRPGFMTQLVKDIKAAIRKADREGFVPVFRLNGTSDIRWENIPVRDGIIGYANIMAMFPNVQFYDYTKITNRRNLPSNYHITFSRSESNDDSAMEQMASHRNVAMVFNVKKGAALPPAYRGVKVVDGDEHDLRFLDPHGVIVGLRGKGEARKGNFGGFVINV